MFLQNQLHKCLSCCFVYFTDCVDGTYGQNCSKVCGNCVQKKECHHSNGSFLTSCNPGFQDHDSKIGKTMSVLDFKKMLYSNVNINDFSLNMSILYLSIRFVLHKPIQ